MFDNLEELITRVRKDLSERDTGETGFFHDSDIQSWLNEAQKDIARKARHLQEHKQVENISGDKFQLPYDYIDLFKLLVNGNEIEDMNKEPEEYGYEIWEDSIRFNWTLDSATIDLHYYRFPQAMVDDTDEPEVPRGYRDLLINYALYRARMKDNRGNEATAFYEKYQNDLRNLYKQFGPNQKVSRVKVMRR